METIIDKHGNCSLCGGVHYGSSKCPYECSRCRVKVSECSEAECPRNQRWAGEEAATKRPRAVLKREILVSLQQQINTLQSSYTIMTGPDKGKITDAGIALDIRCLEEALKIVMDSNRP